MDSRHRQSVDPRLGDATTVMGERHIVTDRRSPLATPAGATSVKPHEKQQHNGTDHGIDDYADHAEINAHRGNPGCHYLDPPGKRNLKEPPTVA